MVLSRLLDSWKLKWQGLFGLFHSSTPYIFWFLVRSLLLSLKPRTRSRVYFEFHSQQLFWLRLQRSASLSSLSLTHSLSNKLNSIFCISISPTEFVKLTLTNRIRMGELKDNEAYEEELLDYEEEDEKAPDSAKPAESGKK